MIFPKLHLSLKIAVFFNLVVQSLFSQDVSYLFEKNNVPVSFYKPDSELVIEDLFSYSIPNTPENHNLNIALSGFKEFSQSADIGLKLIENEKYEIHILAKNHVYEKNDLLNNINLMSLNFSEDFVNSLNSHGNLIHSVDLSTSDASTEQINLLIAGAKNIKNLVLPFTASYDLSQIRFPKSLNKLIIYNQPISNNILNFIRNSNFLLEIVFWGCSISNDIDISILKNKSVNSLESIIVLNCNADLNKVIAFFNYPKLKRIGIDNISVLAALITIKNIQTVDFFTHRIHSTNATGQQKISYVQEMLDHLINSKRDRESENLSVKIISLDN